MKARTRDQQGNLDSLLDTMTGVVGILLIILIVLQLDVGDAVERIVRRTITETQLLPDVSPQEFERLRLELERTPMPMTRLLFSRNLDTKGEKSESPDTMTNVSIWLLA